jgi:18S rRNA (guanine1575-N7)-methyltransferase
MASRPERVAPPEIFYDDTEARKYTSSSRIIDIQVPILPFLLFNFIFLQIQFNSYTIPHQQQSQASLSERALELLALPEDDVPKLLLDIGTLYFNSFISLFLYTLCNV